MNFISIMRRILRSSISPSAKPRRPRLTVESLEAREVPAHNLTIVAGVTDSNIQVNSGGGPTVTIVTTGNDAQISIGKLEELLQDANTQNVIVTTAGKNPSPGQAGTQAGNIIWDAGIAGSLDFTGFGSGKTLTLKTVAGTNAVGNITLTGVQFQGTGGQISLAFDSSDVNGAITFQSGGTGTVGLSAATVRDLTVAAGTGAFSYLDGGTATPADVGGAVSLTAGQTDLTLVDDLTAQGPVSVTAAGPVTLAGGTSLSAGGNLTMTASGGVSAAGADLVATGGAVSISGTVVNLNTIHLTAPTGLYVTGSTSASVSNGLFDVGGPVSITGGTMSLTNVGLPNSGTVGDVTINGSTITLTNTSLKSDRDVAITGTTVNTNALDIEAGRNLTITGPVVAVNGLDLQADGGVSVTGSVNGTADLTLDAAGSLVFGQDIGFTTGLTSLTLLRGALDLGAHNLNAAQVTVGQASGPGEATLGMNGTLTGNVNILATGNVAPGGTGAVGTLNVSGNVVFDGGDLAIDFGAAGAADKLIASGGVTINGASKLGGGFGSGQLTGGLAIVIDAAGGRTGNFINAGAGVPVLVGTDAVTATYTSNQVILTPYAPPGGAMPTAVGLDGDATAFKATLAGGGQVLTGTDWLGRMFLVARNTTALSKLTIVTTSNASSGLVEFPAGVLVSGPLAGFSAPTVNIGTQFRVSGAVTAAVFRDFQNLPGSTGVAFGGLPAQLTSITARNLFGSVQTGGTLASLKVAGALGAQVGDPMLADSVVSAPVITKVTARSATTDFSSPGLIGTLTFTANYNGDVTAASLGSLTAVAVTGDVTATGAVASIKATGAFNGTVTAASVGKFQSAGGFATLRTTGAIGSVTGTGEAGLGLELSASQVGAVLVAGRLAGDNIADGPDWNVTGGITSLTVGAIDDLDLKARFLGAVAVKGNPLFYLGGDISESTFTLTGNDGTTAKVGLKSLTAKGNVRDSRFDVQAGNVGAVTVGRFHDSRLYLNYTPAASGDFKLGSFGGTAFKLASFKTTALPTTDPAHPLHWAFKDSQIVADTIGTVTLSGLKTANSGTAFGIKIRTPGAIVLVTKADVTNSPDLPLNKALTPDKTVPYAALAGDFFFMDV